MDPSCSICDKGRSHPCKFPICIEKHVTPCISCWRPVCDQYPCSILNFKQVTIIAPRICMNCTKSITVKN